jgi:hypothetical protein
METKLAKQKAARQELAQRRKENDSVCGKCYDVLANHWYYDKEKKTFSLRNGTTELLKDVVRGTVTCIEGLSPAAIEGLLGKPTKKTKQWWMYCYCYPCFGEGGLLRTCYFSVEFDTITGKAKRFYVG